MEEPVLQTEWVTIGRIVAPQGLRGEMRVYPSSDFPERFLDAGTRWLQRQGDRTPQSVELLGGRELPGKGLYVVKLEGVESREDAEALRNALLLVPESDRPHLEEDEYHVRDLLGLEVFHQATGERIGVTVEVWSAGNDLLEVQLDCPQLSQKNKKVNPSKKKKRNKPPKPPTVLIPFVKAIVPVVDLAARRIEIDPPLGLIETEKSLSDREDA